MSVADEPFTGSIDIGYHQTDVAVATWLAVARVIALIWIAFGAPVAIIKQVSVTILAKVERSDLLGQFDGGLATQCPASALFGIFGYIGGIFVAMTSDVIHKYQDNIC